MRQIFACKLAPIVHSTHVDHSVEDGCGKQTAPVCEPQCLNSSFLLWGVALLAALVC